MTINHLHIGTRDISKSVDFYARYFNFNKKFEHHPGIFLECEDKKFLLAIDPVENLASLPSWFHFGFCLSSESELLQIYEKMKSENIEIARDLIYEKNEFASFYVNDPDGYRIEVSWHNE